MLKQGGEEVERWQSDWVETVQSFSAGKGDFVISKQRRLDSPAIKKSPLLISSWSSPHEKAPQKGNEVLQDHCWSHQGLVAQSNRIISQLKLLKQFERSR